MFPTLLSGLLGNWQMHECVKYQQWDNKIIRTQQCMQSLFMNMMQIVIIKPLDIIRSFNRVFMTGVKHMSNIYKVVRTSSSNQQSFRPLRIWFLVFFGNTTFRCFAMNTPFPHAQDYFASTVNSVCVSRFLNPFWNFANHPGG